MDPEYLEKDKWPPIIGKNVIINDRNTNNNEKYKGKIIKNIWNNTASVILLKDNPNYKDRTFENTIYEKGHILLLPVHNWSYINDYTTTDYINLLPKGCMGFAGPRIESKNITSEMIKDSNNPYYKPLLATTGIEFSEYDLEILGGTPGESNIRPLIDYQKKILINKLLAFEEIKPIDIKLPVSIRDSITNIIINPDVEIDQGSRIMRNIKNITYDVFSDIHMKIHGGYVIITRKGSPVLDVVTQNNLILKYFTWQYGKPINYHTLKHVLFQNEYQKSINSNKEQIKEAEAIMGLEYIICLQCKSEYQLWCIKRLLMIWYSDKDLENVIRKIKILINHYRSNETEKFNKTNGILPMISIYPRYGIENARLLISKLEHYFSLYIQDDINRDTKYIYIENSTPTYFIKKNSLIYYTNGSIDIKEYIKDSLKCKDLPENESLTNDFTKFKQANEIIKN